MCCAEVWAGLKRIAVRLAAGRFVVVAQSDEKSACCLDIGSQVGFEGVAASLVELS